MATLLVIEHLDVIEQLLLRGPVVGELVREFMLDRREEAFHHGIVIAIATAAHTAHDAVRGEEVLVVLARVGCSPDRSDAGGRRQGAAASPPFQGP